MKTQQRVFTAGIGAMMPVLLNLAVVDLSSIVNEYSLIASIGYLIRTLALFALGGLVGYFYKDEEAPFKIFQLGIGAPALILALVNGTHLPQPAAPDPKAQQASIAFIATAYAADTTSANRFQLPNISAVNQFWNGFSGKPVTNVWFVIAQDNLDLPSAQALRDDIRKKHPELNPQLYYMYGQDTRYAVVVGEHLQQADATALAGRIQSDPDLKQSRAWRLPAR